MRTILFILDALCIFVLTTICSYIDTNIIQKTNNIYLKAIFAFVLEHRFEVAIACGIYVLIYSLLPKSLFLSRSKDRLIRDLLLRINTELFGEDLEHHRITLLKEIPYIEALLINYFAFLWYLLFERKRAKLFLKVPRYGRYHGRYLKVYRRCGLHYETSRTMFRVEKSDPKLCSGIAGLIRYSRMSVVKADLPDITAVNLDDARALKYVPRKSRKDVAKYMEQSYIREFDLLKKINRRARHFCGTTIVKRDGSIWGVLIVDSTSADSPFDKEVVIRFNSFAKTVGEILEMGV